MGLGISVLDTGNTVIGAAEQRVKTNLAEKPLIDKGFTTVSLWTS